MASTLTELTQASDRADANYRQIPRVRVGARGLTRDLTMGFKPLVCSFRRLALFSKAHRLRNGGNVRGNAMLDLIIAVVNCGIRIFQTISRQHTDDG